LLWQLKFYMEFNCLNHEHIALGFKFELFGINWRFCGCVLLDRYKLLSYAP
jgi:hypothetical protein